MYLRIRFGYYGVSSDVVKNAFAHVAKYSIPDGQVMSFQTKITSRDGEVHVQYFGKPFIVARDQFEAANRIVYRFLTDTGKIHHEISRCAEQVSVWKFD